METRGLEDFPENLSGFYRLRYKHHKLHMMFTTFHPTLTLTEIAVKRCVREGHEIESLCSITVNPLPKTLAGMIDKASAEHADDGEK